MPSGNVTSSGFWSDSYHDFAVLWLPDLLAWYIDGKQYFNTTKFVPNTPAYIVLDNEVGLGHKEGPDGGWAGNPSTTIFPQEMRAEHVTVWRRVGGFKTDDAASVINISVGWDEPPLAVSPAINSWHDTPLGASGNPHHDDVSRHDIISLPFLRMAAISLLTGLPADHVRHRGRDEQGAKPAPRTVRATVELDGLSVLLAQRKQPHDRRPGGAPSQQH